MKLGEKIKKLRTKKNISQKELAAKISINPVNLSKIEQGKSSTSIEFLKRLADTLEVTTDYLLNDSEGDYSEIKLEDESMVERIKMLNSIDGKDRDAIIHIIDSILTKRKILNLLHEKI